MLMFDPYVDLDEQAAWVPDGAAVPTYAHLMCVLMERSIDAWHDADGVIHPKLTMEERGVHCIGWARHYAHVAPQLSDDLHVAAQRFAAIASGTKAP